MERCDQIEACSFFRTAIRDLPTVAEMMKKRYCEGDFGSCARKLVLSRLGGEHVPATLAPGDHQRARQIIEAEG